MLAPRHDSVRGPGSVLHIVPALFGKGGIVGGAERYVLELARHMSTHVPTTLLTFGDVSREEQLGSLRIKLLGPAHYVRGQRSNPVHAGLVREVLRADVVHCHQQHVVASTLAAIVARIRGRRVFVSDLGGGGWDISSYISTDALYHGHLHISQYSREVLGHRTLDTAHVILGGVDIAKFSPDPAVPRDGGGLFVGRMVPHKGVDSLIKAAEPGLPVTLIGEPYHEAFVEHLHALATGKPVRFVHGADDDALVDAYRRASCVVLPSVYQPWDGVVTRVPELLGQALLEGMACGAPAICTAVASMPEIVTDGVTGFIVPPGDAETLRDRMRWIQSHPAEARVMGARARQDVEQRFTWPAVVDRCLAHYAGALPRASAAWAPTS